MDIINNDPSRAKEVSPGCYEVQVPSKALQGSAAAASSDVGFKIGSGDVTALVYVSDGYITKMEYDFSGIISGVDAFDVTILFSNYNNAGDVVFPSSTQ